MVTSPPDDLISQLSLESYIDHRVRPYVDNFETTAPKVARFVSFLEFGAIFTNTAGSILAVLGYADYVPITVAVAAILMALNDFFKVDVQLNATNSAVQKGQNLLHMWDRLTGVQKKQPDIKQQCAVDLETAVLEIIQAKTGASAMIPPPKSEEAEAEEGAEEARQSSRGSRKRRRRREAAEEAPPSTDQMTAASD